MTNEVAVIDEWTGSVLSHGQLLDSRPAALAAALVATVGDAKLIWYLSTALHGGPTVVSGVVLTPKGDPPAAGWPVIAWGSGGFGVSDRTAPSRSPRLASRDHGAYVPFLAGLLEAGYVVAATDYEGQGTPGVRPFQAPHSEGRSMIDAVIAARQLHPALGERWFAMGHSGGGHAALETAETSDAGYAGTLCLLGCVAMEPAGDFTWILDQVERLMAGGVESPTFRAIYAALVVGLKAQHPELRLADYLGTRALERIELTYDDTQATASAAYPELPGDEFAPRSEAAAGRMRAWLAASAVPRHPSSAPIFFPTGERQSHRPMVKRSLDRAQELGGAVLVRLYPEVDHRQLLNACLPDVLGWLRDRLAALPVPGS